MKEQYKIYNGDCLEVMEDIPDKSVDMILCDLPYGTTACKWDNIIPLDEMWERLNKLVKDNGAIILFGTQPFTTDLINSNRKWLKHINYWNKENCGNFAIAKYRPLAVIEEIIVFSNGKLTYNPQMVQAEDKNKRPRKNGSKTKEDSTQSIASGYNYCTQTHNENLRFPKNLLTYNNRKGELNSTKRLHPTQKPVELLEWLIKTYSNENETVLDFTMGSGSTGVACVNTNRKFIGIELDENYFNIAKERIEEAVKKKEELLKVFDKSN